jgi:hypothetical protein
LAVLLTTDARQVLLSGVMGNAQQVAGWLDGSEPQTSPARPGGGPPRFHALHYSHIVWDREQRLPPTSRTFTLATDNPIIADLRAWDLTCHASVRTSGSLVAFHCMTESDYERMGCQCLNYQRHWPRGSEASSPQCRSRRLGWQL